MSYNIQWGYGSILHSFLGAVGIASILWILACITAVQVLYAVSIIVMMVVYLVFPTITKEESRPSNATN